MRMSVTLYVHYDNNIIMEVSIHVMYYYYHVHLMTMHCDLEIVL